MQQKKNTSYIIPSGLLNIMIVSQFYCNYNYSFASNFPFLWNFPVYLYYSQFVFKVNYAFVSEEGIES